MYKRVISILKLKEKYNFKMLIIFLIKISKKAIMGALIVILTLNLLTGQIVLILKTTEKNGLF